MPWVKNNRNIFPMKNRYLADCIAEDLKNKMVFISGPRQVGKTSLGMEIAKKHFNHVDYLNWDARDDRKRIVQANFFGDADVIMLDEIHKFDDWKNHIKGLFDKHNRQFSILVTGSARLDVYRRGGDSLMGRYYAYRLHPFSMAEMIGKQPAITPFETIEFPASSMESVDTINNLTKFGGFPEPLFAQSNRELRRWHNQRVDRLVKEDIRDVENIKSLSQLQILVDVLPQRVGSLLSLNALREDFSVAHKTIAHWMDILERFYYHFRIYPFNHNKIRSLKKNPKLYLWDWSEVPDQGGARLENLVASHLLKLCHYLQDVQGYKTALHFLRDVDGREVDFLVTESGEPWFAVEVKHSAAKDSNHLSYFADRLQIPLLYQVVAQNGVDKICNNIRTISVDKFLLSMA
ncbi:MAG: ATP-binding protein [Mariprofundales bacterium]